MPSLMANSHTSLELFQVSGFQMVAWLRGQISTEKNKIIKPVLDITNAYTSGQIPYHERYDSFRL